jgi:hypothetical protein
MVTLNPIFAAGLFDNPLLIVVIVLVSALVNWLSKRREGKPTDQSANAEEPTGAPSKPTHGFNLEETLRRLMGEEMPVPAPPPPPLPREASRGVPPVTVRRKETPPAGVPAVPPLLTPPPGGTRARVASTAAGGRREQAARRFEQLNEQGQHPATVVRHRYGMRSSTAKRAAARWRDPRSARQAFVASLVFAPPKGLES